MREKLCAYIMQFNETYVCCTIIRHYKNRRIGEIGHCAVIYRRFSLFIQTWTAMTHWFFGRRNRPQYMLRINVENDGGSTISCTYYQNVRCSNRCQLQFLNYRTLIHFTSFYFVFTYLKYLLRTCGNYENQLCIWYLHRMYYISS